MVERLAPLIIQSAGRFYIGCFKPISGEVALRNVVAVIMAVVLAFAFQTPLGETVLRNLDIAVLRISRRNAFQTPLGEKSLRNA